MSQSGDVAETMTRMYLQGFEVGLRVTGSGAEKIMALILATMKDKRKTTGKTNLTNMLKSGKELKVFSVKQDKFAKFTEEAKRYGVLYSALINKKTSSRDGVVDIMVKAEDAAKINRIVDRFKLSDYDEVTIRSDIEKTRIEKNKGVITKTVEQKNSEEKQDKPIKKEDYSLNPHLAKTEKSPQSKPSLEMQKTSDQGTKINEKPSVKEKLKKAKEEVKVREKSKVISEVDKVKINIKEKNR
jgi:hypothetical protein